MRYAQLGLLVHEPGRVTPDSVAYSEIAGTDGPPLRDGNTIYVAREPLSEAKAKNLPADTLAFWGAIAPARTLRRRKSAQTIHGGT